jgi:hypothetical protein
MTAVELAGANEGGYGFTPSAFADTTGRTTFRHDRTDASR